MNAFFLRKSSLKAEVRSTRTHSASLSTKTPFSRPHRIRHYIACKQSGQADTSSGRRAEKEPPAGSAGGLEPPLIAVSTPELPRVLRPRSLPPGDALVAGRRRRRP